MKDNCQRDITYLRLSVTDLCNLRCRYCMPAEGVAKKLHSEICSVEELVEMAAAAADCGITKVRLTGGEPLVRRGIVRHLYKKGIIKKDQKLQQMVLG